MNDQAMQRPWLKAYSLGSADEWAIEPASSKRAWMDDTFKRIAYRCLPLVAANQMGWVVRCPASFTAIWSGKPDNHGVRIAYEEDSAHLAGTAISHFGGGVLTFVLPWLFRTSPGFGLVLRGPTNEIKEHAIPLDAVIETDWSPYTFTMNWRLSQPEVPVRFRKGDAVCMLQPYPLALLEQFDCSFEPFADAPPEIQRGFDDFVHGRGRNLEKAPQGQYATQRDYFAGRYPDGSPARYPVGTVASAVAVGCPVEASAASPEREALPAPAHRMGFDLKPFRR
jgi:hypothetical protein